MEKLAVLIIESNAADSELISDHLNRAALQVGIIDRADSLHAALERFAHTAYDVALANLMLTDSNGLETIRSIVSAAPETAIVVISEDNSHALASRSIHFGAQEHLEKQYISPILLQKSLCYAIERHIIMQEKEDVLNDLGTALEKLGSLENILPFCVNCRKIRNTAGQWLDLEDYIAEYEHQRNERLICPICRQDL